MVFLPHLVSQSLKSGRESNMETLHEWGFNIAPDKVNDEGWTSSAHAVLIQSETIWVQFDSLTYTDAQPVLMLHTG